VLYKDFYIGDDVPVTVLDESLFTDEMREKAREQTGLVSDDGDWWTMEPNNPILTWEELIGLALKVLNSEMTRLVMGNQHLKIIPGYEIQSYTELPEDYAGGSKRVNAKAGYYYDCTDGVGIEGLKNHLAGKDIEPIKTDLPKSKFYLHGKDDSCMVEGFWRDWVCFALNILASKNTELIAPELFESELANSNY